MGNHNYKVQDTFYNYGCPKLYIIEICSIETLGSSEILWTLEFNSINSGLNIIEAGNSVGYGENSSGSKYKNDQIVEVFKLLVHQPDKTFSEIEQITKVSVGTIKMVSCSKAHTWLEQKFQEEYTILKQLKGSRNSAKHKGIQYPSIVSPENIVFTVANLSKFARENGLQSSHLCQVLRGDRPSHKGWTLSKINPLDLTLV